jgi:hypothetical protein
MFMGFFKSLISARLATTLLCICFCVISLKVVAQDYPSTLGYSLLIGTKNTSRIGLDPVEQRSFGSYGAGIFWDCYPRERFSFFTELEFMQREGKGSMQEFTNENIMLYYLQAGFSAKWSYKREPVFKPYVLGGLYGMSLIFRDNNRIPEGYLRHALELRLGIGFTHVFFSRRFAIESTYRNARLTFKDDRIRQGAEGYYITLRYYWSRSTIDLPFFKQ